MINDPWSRAEAREVNWLPNITVARVNSSVVSSPSDWTSCLTIRALTIASTLNATAYLRILPMNRITASCPQPYLSDGLTRLPFLRTGDCAYGPP